MKGWRLEPGCNTLRDTVYYTKLTVDLRDFGAYRLKGGKRFEVVKWFAPWP